jgi:hypothetical protein
MFQADHVRNGSLADIAAALAAALANVRLAAEAHIDTKRLTFG